MLTHFTFNLLFTSLEGSSRSVFCTRNLCFVTALPYLSSSLTDIATFHRQSWVAYQLHRS